ncbi:MAG: 16S rRNA (cytosine(1402)-N(4))-methyltransferase, partial [Christensenellaceae bacterium]
MTHDGHVPVLFQETLDALLLQDGKTIVDGTLGGGGHSLG